MKHLTQEDKQAIRFVPVEMAEIVQEVANETGVPWAKIMSRSNIRPHARARQLVMFVARRHGMSLIEIGRFLQRDHTSVLHGIRAEQKRRQTNEV